VAVALAPGASGGAVITVTDSGIGIDEAQIARAFEPFWQADSGLDRLKEGAGIGLPLARSWWRCMAAAGFAEPRRRGHADYHRDAGGSGVGGVRRLQRVKGGNVPAASRVCRHRVAGLHHRVKAR